mgnify:FL=1
MTLETINSLLVLYGLIVTVAAILMYVKQWQMASDIRAIHNHFIKANEPKNITASLSEETDYDKRLDNVKPGDKVKRAYDGKIMTVAAVCPDGICCYAGVIDGKQTYPKSSLEYIIQ